MGGELALGCEMYGTARDRYGFGYLYVQVKLDRLNCLANAFSLLRYPPDLRLR